MRHSLRIDAVLVQAVIAGALSFAHLHDLAAAAGQTGWKAWAYPVSVDLLLVAAWRRLRNDGPSRLAWCWFLIALVASLGANVATAGLLDLAHPPSWLRVGIAGWPALAFLGGTLLAHSPAEPQPVPEPVDDLPAEPVTTHEPATAAVETPESAPALPAAPPVAVSAPAPLVAHARKVADAHRAATGNPIDTDTLRARLGVPAPMAEAIAAQLT
ncbi:DUF2637 domain-containing protein [Streptomyces lunaelactis]|uniref:DUF2637 domain-containing protein n=1 Tax=Streptomyces lunaelactis TaxID=1535768 RepID=UPI001585A7CB|nr:DUF2637 domain-containing protein [Streptomyces lunaelactis]NUK52451.1 DUF2637 domain-containing protein [Streptomyces lunaelactis]NUK66727.1 DUF2637 domain-containing protein [Streptomyces lunaelactis]